MLALTIFNTDARFSIKNFKSRYVNVQISSISSVFRMSDNYSEDEYEETARDTQPMVVEVRGHGTRGSVVSGRRSPSSGRRSARSMSGAAHKRRAQNQ